MIIITLQFSTLLLAESIHQERGKWWGKGYELEKDSEEEPTNEEKYNLPPLPAKEELMKMHPEQLREMEQKYLDQAIWKRDEESVKEYYTLVAAFRAMSRGFAAVHNYVTMTSPELSTADMAPSTPMGIKTKKANILNDLNSKLKSEYRNFGLMIFMSGSCGACKVMHPLYKAFAIRHGWQVQYIDVEQRPDLVDHFKVKVTPTVIMVQSNTNNHQTVSHGVVALPNLETNIYRSLRLMKGEIDMQQFLTMEHQMGSSLDPLAKRKIQ
ncbi:conjugal transfer protein TraF [Oleiphilus sp. HI0043]|uniref:conjugal transfer protein TraF n=3 Tax=unclassified Oleiphilus TaxID=2631174 RepID=UPI0018D35647|nr:conjugal transfer protein TraF [Oleiphilus sp. HI0043]